MGLDHPIGITRPASKSPPQGGPECRPLLLRKIKANLDDTIVIDSASGHRIELNPNPIVKELKRVNMAVPRPSLAASFDIHVVHPEANIPIGEHVLTLSHQITLSL